ncbi:MAG: hypothetical protein HQ521_04465 [Bacteroidetes bacterium]|nr:hypothetical protein [Bacteroidota bacterium]
MTNKEKLQKEESFDLITEMINRAKGNIQSGYIFFLIWGWIIAIASLLNYILLEFTNYEHPEKAWFIIIIGIILSAWYGYKIGKNAKVHTYADKIYGQIWFVFFVNYIIVLVFMKVLNYNITPLILLLAGGSTYLSGIVIKFKPLIIGGLVLWGAAIICFLVPGEMQLLVSAISIILGYLVPGYILKSRNNSQNV